VRARAPTLATVRVALYTRKSTTKGLDQKFNSIEAQRECLEKFVAGHAAEGWIALATRYDDGGVSGATTNRPAWQRLLTDVKHGLIDMVAVYKPDRLSRDSADAALLMKYFRSVGVAIISPTERLDQETASDRLSLGLRIQVWQYEREIAAERIRDKMRAARAKGQWQGGRPVLGYDVVNKTLAVNHAEAKDVVAIFESFARTTSLVATLRELEARGIRLKSWTTKRGKRNEGAAFRDHSLRTLLANPLYVGRIHAGDVVVDGEHEAIVPRQLFDEVQALLASGRRQQAPRQAWGALLTGLIHCAVCGSAMVPSYCSKGGTRYGYYTCQRIKESGATACPGSRVAQGAVEAAVVERIMAIGRDPALVAEAVQAARAEVDAQAAALAQDVQRSRTEAHRLAAERDALVAHGADVPELRQRLEELRHAHEAATQRATEAKDELAALKARVLDEAALRRAIERVAPCWDALFPGERASLIRLLVERVRVDARTGEVDIAFHPGGVRELARGDATP
jgi:site-specific DNA recombinase